MLTMLVMIISNLQGKGNKLDQINILNMYLGDITCELQWRNRNLSHTRQRQVHHIPKNKKYSFKAPLLGYGIEKILIRPAQVTAVLTGTLGLTKSKYSYWEHTILAHGNSFFLVTPGNHVFSKILAEDLINEKYKGNAYIKPNITGYKNEQEYKDSIEGIKETITNSTLIETNPNHSIFDKGIEDFEEQNIKTQIEPVYTNSTDKNNKDTTESLKEAMNNSAAILKKRTTERNAKAAINKTNLDSSTNPTSDNIDKNTVDDNTEVDY
jgi:hypothetical protein